MIQNIQLKNLLPYILEPNILSVIAVLCEKASTEDSNYGQISISLEKLSQGLPISRRQTERIIKLLERDGLLECTSTRQGSTITLTGLLPANTKKKAVTTATEDWRKHPLLPRDFNGTWSEALDIVLKPRREKFAQTIQPHINSYGRDMCNDFYRYWTEPVNREEGTKLTLIKMRFEKQETWSLTGRLTTWYKKSHGK